MSTIFKIIGMLIAIAYSIFCIPLVLLLLVIMPIMTISDGIKIIITGSSVTGEYVSIMVAILVLVYISLRFRNLRRIYYVFPFLFETIKFLCITNMFISVGTEVMNWCYTTMNKTRHILGIMAFLVFIVLWRVFISIYYYKKPLVDFIPGAEDDIKNLSNLVAGDS